MSNVGSGILERLQSAERDVMLRGAHRDLSATGSGVHVIDDAIDPDVLAKLGVASNGFPWVDNHSTFITKSGRIVDQRRDTYGLDLTSASIDEIDETLAMVVRILQQVVRLYSEKFSSLSEWSANDISLHRYNDQELGLSRHQDLSVFTGVVAILGVEGVCDFSVFTNDTTHTVRSVPGALMLLRVTGLIGDPNNQDGQRELNVEHMVGRLYTPTRMSLVVRNKTVRGAVPGFYYSRGK